MKPAELTDLRPSPIAGTWYPSNSNTLREMVETFLQNATPPPFTGEPRGLIVPHAGYQYSGQTCAYAFKALQERQVSRVILLSPYHSPNQHPLLTTAHNGYATPLGAIPVDRQALDDLNHILAMINGPGITPVRGDHEHSLEIELPFLQVCLPDGFSLLPLMMVSQTYQMVLTLSDALVRLIETSRWGSQTLLVASSDLSHFYSERTANRLDGALAEAVQDFDLKAFFRRKQQREMEACGLAPMAAVLETLRRLGARQVTIADYRTSAAVTGDKSSVVGYLSAIISDGEVVRHD